MRRRDLLKVAGLGAASLALPRFGLARSGDLPLVGVLFSSTSAVVAAEDEGLLRDGLALSGWVVGEAVQVVIVRTAGDIGSIRTGVEQLIALQADVLYAWSGPRAQELVRAVPAVPVVFSNTPDPVRYGIVESLARPSGGVTGFYLSDDNFGKMAQLLATSIPDMTRIGFVYDVEATPSERFPFFQKAADGLSLDPVLVGLGDPEEYARSIAAFSEPNSGLLVDGVTELTGNREQLISAINTAGIPAIYYWPDYAQIGGLVSHGPDWRAPIRQAGIYIGRILNGERVEDLPVQASREFYVVLNLSTAAAQGVTFPPELLAIADEVIENRPE
jgi:putative ABC transport system substrate-binding protein